MNIIGIGGILNEPACAVLRDGELTAAVEENKLTRHHRPGQLPEASIGASLQLAGITAADVDCVAIVRPLAAEAPIHLNLRSRFPNSQIVLVEHQAGSRRLGILCVAIRGGDRTDTRPDGRLPLRRALARLRQLAAP